MSENDLKKKIIELESELKNKEQLIAKYRTELSSANHRLQEMIADLSQELKLAMEIQKKLSPTEIPNISGVELSTKFIPGMKSGGDYFDIFEHEDRLKFGILLASSSGYTMSALFLSVLMKLSGQIEARRGLEPDQVLSSVAKELIPHMQKNDKASLFYGVMDRRTFEFKFSFVGDIFVCTQPYANSHISRFEPTTGPLSKDYQQKPLSQTISMGARDRLILCTEGVYLHPAGIMSADLIGKAIMHAPRSGVHELRNEILYQWEQIAKVREVERDQTVLVLEVKDRVIKLAKK